MEDMNKRFELFNSKGTMVQLDQDGRNMFTVVGADTKVIRQEEDAFWIAWREIWYFNSSCSPGCHSASKFDPFQR